MSLSTNLTKRVENERMSVIANCKSGAVSNLLNLLGPIHQTISAIPSYLQIRLAARLALQRLNSGASSHNQSIEFRIDLQKIYPGLGDFLLDLVLARALSSLIPHLELQTRLEGTLKNKENLESLGLDVSKRLEDFSSVIGLNPTNLRIAPEPCSASAKLDAIDVQTALNWKWARKRFLSSGNIFLVNLIAQKTGIRPTEFFSWSPAGKYVGFHVRGSRHNHERNPSQSMTAADLSDLSRVFPKHEIRIFSDPPPDFLYSMIRSSQELGIKVSLQKSKTFDETIMEILCSDFWFQRKGGGVSIPVLYSQMPYVMLSRDYEAKVQYGIAGDKFGKWSQPNQLYMTSVRKSETWSLFSILRDKQYPSDGITNGIKL